MAMPRFLPQPALEMQGPRWIGLAREALGRECLEIGVPELVLLAAEWLVFHRPTRQRLGRAMGRRPQPLGGRAR